MKLPSSACVTLLVLYGAEMALIFTLNFLIILVFVRNRSLRKRSMYLVINLAVTDMLIAAFPVPYNYFYIGQMCSIWKVQRPIGFEVLFWLWNVFPIASLTNLAAISIEKVHATFRPFKHRVITKRVYGAIIAANWLLTVLLTSYLLVTYKTEGAGYYVWNSFNAICLFVICVSYVSISVKVYCRTPPQHHRTVSREKKLTKTLFIVTLVSLLLWLPYTVCSFLYYSTDITTSLSPLAIDLFGLYILFSQYRSCDNTQEAWSFVLFIKKSACRHYCRSTVNATRRFSG
ncbi:substance-K receptor-like [Montipora foliosa]|uniref:substance-K receptor-like n=1 Tax=Montipora foliosa TaxID=591990 RepID=UPI0035F13826